MDRPRLQDLDTIGMWQGDTDAGGGGVPVHADLPDEAPLRFVGFFPSGDVTSRFEEPLMPPGEREFRTVEG